MGQAKLRGTKQDRVAAGVAKRVEREARHERERAAAWARLSPEAKAWLALSLSFPCPYKG
jgi:hypothetical protein